MKKLLLTPAIVLIGCASSPDPGIIDEIIPDETLHIPSNVAEREEWDGSKGQFPPGRVIDYKGHGLGYTSHMQHYLHLQHIHGPACLCHLHRR
jgi:hypothetical protein